MADLIFTAVTKYNWHDIEPMVVSLEKSGFVGTKIMVVFEMKKALMDKLSDRGWIVVPADQRLTVDGDAQYRAYKTFNICVDRFFFYQHILKNLEGNVDNVLAIDAKDVIFQDNPNHFFQKIKEMGKKDYLLVSKEGLTYENEPWAVQNMNLSFGQNIYNRMKDKEIVNAGVMAGSKKIMEHIFFNIAMYCRGIQQHIPGGGGPDQAAYNIIVNDAIDINAFDVLSMEQWACQAGTVSDPNKIDHYRPNLLTEEPLWDEEIVKTLYKKYKYCIVHQYDRVPEWREHFLKKYRD